MSSTEHDREHRLPELKSMRTPSGIRFLFDVSDPSPEQVELIKAIEKSWKELDGDHLSGEQKKQQ